MEHHLEAELDLAANYCVVVRWLGNVTEALGYLKSSLHNVRSLPPVEGEAALQRQKRIAKAQFVLGMGGLSGSSLPEVTQSLQEAISISRLTGDKLILGYSLEMYYILSQFTNVPNAPAAAEEGLNILSEINDNWGMGVAYTNMVRVASMRGDQAEKQKYYELVKERVQDAPLSVEVGMVYLTLGFDERFQGNFELSKQHFQDGLALFRQMRNKNFECVMLSELGHLARIKGDFVEAKTLYRQTILGWQELGARPAVANQLECFAAIAIVEKNPRRAAKLFGAAEIIRNKAQSPMTDYEQKEYDQSIAQLRSMLSETEVNGLWAEGRSLTMAQAIRLALEEKT
jgi:tetratricopeptide (TPR) repeat protein